MNANVKQLLTNIKFGKPTVVNGVAIMAIFNDHRSSIEYLTLEEAIQMNVLKITEVSAGGSVPELKTDNCADKPILLIDGEELIGAKQNRILNISVLLKEKSSTTIPVSCVERGRWSYRTMEFKPSQNVMPPKARAFKTKSVSENISCCECANSNQGLVWEEVDKLHHKLGTTSHSDAMYDAFAQKRGEIEKFLNSLKPEKDQIGYVVFVEDKPQTLEIIPNAEKYPLYHNKFVTASIIDAIGDRLMDISAEKQVDYETVAKNFVDSVLGINEHEYKPVGYGMNLRYDAADITGAALVHQDCVLHAVFFKLSDDGGKSMRRRPSMPRGSIEL